MRVNTVRQLRRINASPLMSGLVTAILIGVSSSVVSLNDIVRNTMNNVDWTSRFSYAFSSLIHSRLIVQSLVLLILFSCIMVVINLWKTANFGSGQRNMVGAGTR